MLAPSGIGDGAQLPAQWDLPRAEHPVAYRFRARHSSPIVWDDLVFVTTAVSTDPNATFRRALRRRYASPDRSEHQWQVIALDRNTGKVRWTQTAYRGVPREKRHIKSTYANQTPATDGDTVVAFFGSQGLYAYDMKGALRWKQDLGILDPGYAGQPDLSWGYASSPVIYRGLVIVQCDVRDSSFLRRLASDRPQPLEPSARAAVMGHADRRRRPRGGNW